MGFIPNEVIGQILDRCDIVEVISSYFPLKRAGRNFKALCPFHHEKTPSFVVNPDKQIFHCFGCGIGGNILTFVIHQEHVDFPAAVRMLATKAGITIPESDTKDKRTAQLRQQLQTINELAASYFHQNLISSKQEPVKEARKYLRSRKIDLAAAKHFRLGFAFNQWDGLINFLRKKDVALGLMEKAGLILPQKQEKGFYDRFRNRIMFPIFDSKGGCVAFGGRTMQANDSAKYINSPETPLYTKGEHLYGFHLAKETIARQDEVIVVEGYFDFITPFQSGVTNIVASLGTALTIEQIRLIRRYTRNVVMLFDADTAGEMAMARSLDLLIEEGMNVKVATLDPGEDPDSYVWNYGVRKFEERLAAADSLFDFKLKFLKTKYASESIEDKAKIIAEILPTVNNFDNAVIQSEYIKRLADALNVSYEAVLREFKKEQKTSGKTLSLAPGLDRQKSARLSAAVYPAERNILKLMLEEEDFIPLTKKEVDLTDFQDQTIRRIVEKIYRFVDENQQVGFSGLMSCFTDEETLKIISGLMVATDPVKGNKNKIYQDCVRRLKKDRLKQMRQNLLTQMEDAKAAGDSQKLEQLAEEFNHLIKG